MLFVELATTSAAVGATRSRLAKRALLATSIRAAEPDEIELVVTYLSGSLRQRRTGVGWASLSSVPSPAAAPTLTVRAVDAAFEQIAAIGGTGSAAARATAVEALFARATEDEQRLLRGLVFDEIRQGALDSLVQDGLAEAFGVPAAAVQRASMLLGSTAAAARLLVTEGLAGLQAVGLQVGVPVRPMLAAAAPDPAAAVLKSGLPALVDTKLDGIRVQVHRDGDEIRLYTGVWTTSRTGCPISSRRWPRCPPAGWCWTARSWPWTTGAGRCRSSRSRQGRRPGQRPVQRRSPPMHLPRCR